MLMKTPPPQFRRELVEVYSAGYGEAPKMPGPAKTSTSSTLLPVIRYDGLLRCSLQADVLVKTVFGRTMCTECDVEVSVPCFAKYQVFLKYYVIL